MKCWFAVFVVKQFACFVLMSFHPFSLSVVFLHKWSCRLTTALLSRPAVLSVSAVHHMMFMFCGFLMSSGYGSLCFCGLLNVWGACQTRVSSALRSHSRRLTRVTTSVFSLCVVFRRLRSFARLLGNKCPFHHCCSRPMLNTDILLQLVADSNSNWLQT